MTATQADFLDALADHMRRHGLSIDDRCNLSWDHCGGWSLQVLGTNGPPEDVLVAWARSLGVSGLVVRELGGKQVNVQFASTLGGVRVDVWTTADWLRHVLDLPDRADVSLPVSELQRLAQLHAAEGGGRP